MHTLWYSMMMITTSKNCVDWLSDTHFHHYDISLSTTLPSDSQCVFFCVSVFPKKRKIATLLIWNIVWVWRHIIQQPHVNKWTASNALMWAFWYDACDLSILLRMLCYPQIVSTKIQFVFLIFSNFLFFFCNCVNSWDTVSSMSNLKMTHF